MSILAVFFEIMARMGSLVMTGALIAFPHPLLERRPPC
jgi:hypothetical protein